MRTIAIFSSVLTIGATVIAACGPGDTTSSTGGSGGSATTTSSATGGSGGTGGVGGTTSSTPLPKDTIQLAKACVGNVKVQFPNAASPTIDLVFKINSPQEVDAVLYSLIVGDNGSTHCRDNAHTIYTWDAPKGLFSSDPADYPMYSIPGGNDPGPIADHYWTPDQALQVSKGASYFTIQLKYDAATDTMACFCGHDPVDPDPFKDQVFGTNQEAPPFQLQELTGETKFRPHWIFNAPPPPPTPAPSLNQAFAKFLTVGALGPNEEIWYVPPSKLN